MAEPQVAERDKPTIAGPKTVQMKPRRRLRFGLAGALIALTAISIGFGLFAQVMANYWAEERVMRLVPRTFQCTFFIGTILPELIPRIPQPRFFDRCVEVLADFDYFPDDPNRTSISDAELAKLVDHLAQLKRLKKLEIIGDEITNDGLQSLAKLKQLETLNLRCPQVTSSGTERLERALPGLTIVDD